MYEDTFVVLCTLLSVVAAGAPEDSSPFCTGELLSEGGLEPPPPLPSHVAVLMDSYNYLVLLGDEGSGAVWQHVDLDTNNQLGRGTEWSQNTNVPCRQALSACGFEIGEQNNWLITQYISRRVNGVLLSQVSIQVVFELQGCTRVANCRRSFSIYRWDTSVENSTAARKTGNYRQVMNGVVAIDDSSGSSLQNQTRDMIFDNEEEGFYIAIRDDTTCISILRLVIFYLMDPPTSTTTTSTTTTTSSTTSTALPLMEEATLHFELGGTTYLNNTVVKMDDIGEQDNALLCVTSSQDCCTTDRHGEFYYPDGTLVPTLIGGEDFYRNRGDGFIRLNRRNGATSPTGIYRCEIPDAAGNLQNIVIEIIAVSTCPSTPTPQPCPSCPQVTCPTPTDQVTCPPPPEVTCPPTPSCPTPKTTSPSPPPSPLHFKLGAATFNNNTVIPVNEIGEQGNALFCITNNQNCCKAHRRGEFFHPDGTLVRSRSRGKDFYRNRGNGFIRLNRRNNAFSPTGMYRCEIPDVNGNIQNIVVYIIS